jgi:chromosome segregation ATPase
MLAIAGDIEVNPGPGEKETMAAIHQIAADISTISLKLDSVQIDLSDLKNQFMTRMSAVECKTDFLEDKMDTLQEELLRVKSKITKKIW